MKALWQVPEGFTRIYAHAVEVPAKRRLLFVAGQIGRAPDGTLAEGFEAQCRQSMVNVAAALAQAGMGIADLVKVTYLLTDASDQAALLASRREYWASATPPAVTVMVVAGLATPDLFVEIEAVAAAP